MTLSSIAYATRPHVANDGPELSHSNLKKFASAESAPSISTLLQIVKLLSATKRLRSSMISALISTYPEVLVKIVIGLDVIGLDQYWKTRRNEDQLTRQIDRMKLQIKLGKRGMSALPQPDESRPWTKPPPRRLMNWLDVIGKHHDLHAVCLAYALFCPVENDLDAMMLFKAFVRFNEFREAMYWEALSRYKDFNPRNDNLAGPELLRAQEIMADHRLSIGDRKRLATPCFAMWVAGHAHVFVDTVPLLEWVDKDTLRESLGMP